MRVTLLNSFFCFKDQLSERNQFKSLCAFRTSFVFITNEEKKSETFLILFSSFFRFIRYILNHKRIVLTTRKKVARKKFVSLEMRSLVEPRFERGTKI